MDSGEREPIDPGERGPIDFSISQRPGLDRRRAQNPLFHSGTFISFRHSQNSGKPTLVLAGLIFSPSTSFLVSGHADQVKALNSFKFDVLGHIIPLALNSMKKGYLTLGGVGLSHFAELSQEFCTR